MDDNQKKELTQAMMSIDYYPQPELVNIDLEEKQKFPMSQLTNLGVAFHPLSQIFQKAIGIGQGGSGIYYVNTKGSVMHTFNNGSGYLGSLQAVNGGVGGGQAIINSIPFDPTMLCMAGALMSIEKKLDAIQETQKEILAFLELKEEAKLKGNLNTLIDILNNYKYNWDNEKYKDHKHILVQEIKRDAEQGIILYSEQLTKNLKKGTFLHSDQEIKSALNKSIAQLNDYQMTLYVFSFSSFLEVMLLENFDSNYLNSIIDKIKEYKNTYNQIYNKCYEKFENDSKKSLQSYALKGLSKVSSGTGKLVEKIPVISKSQLDENLIKAGSKLSDINTNRTQNVMQTLSDNRADRVDPFVENIKMVSMMYNEPVELLFDENYIYLGLVAGNAN